MQKELEEFQNSFGISKEFHLNQFSPESKEYCCLRLVKKIIFGTSLVVQFLRPCASTAGDTGSIPGRGTRILYVKQCGQKKIVFFL